MIEKRIINNSYTEIYAGGGNFITQSTPTNFHQFFKRKILTPSDNIEDYREVTAAEKALLEESDAKWVAPSEELRAEWDAACTYGKWQFGRYNEATGFFELNGITDISLDEAIRIFATRHRRLVDRDGVGPALEKLEIRTMFPVISFFLLNGSQLFGASKVEVVRVLNYYIVNNTADPDTYPTEIYQTGNFAIYSIRLREVKGVLSVRSDIAASHFRSSITTTSRGSLETMWVKGIWKDVRLEGSENFRPECIRYMVDNALEGHAPLTIYVHSLTYSNLPEELIAVAAADNITIAIP